MKQLGRLRTAQAQNQRFESWRHNTHVPKTFTPVTHEVTVEKPHGVTYTFENNDGLPTEVQNLLPTQDTNKYYKGDSVNLPTLTENTKTIDGIKYTFEGWYVGSTEYKANDTYTMDDDDVTFVGKWNSVTVNPKYKLRYVFKSGDDTITTLPDVVTRQIPADSEELVEKNRGGASARL